jgi:hypothetical protein
MVTQDSVVVVARDQVACDVRDELLILNATSGGYFGLDPLGKRIWSLMRDPVRMGEILNVILEEYDVDQERCERDLRVFLQQLADKGLIEVRSAAAE